MEVIRMTTYYWIREVRLGKKDENGYFLFEKNQWVKDEKNYILDKLMGYDPCEPDDSPYKMGNLSIMDEVEEITEERAKEIMNQMTIDFLKEKWKKDLVTKKEEWDKAPGWPAKLVETRFTLNGIEYTILPQDLGLTDDCWDQGFMETIQSDLKRDLEAIGATDIYNLGFLD